MKRRDPWPRANAPPEAVADPELSGEDATNRSHRRVFTWFASRWRNHQPKRAEKPHSKFSGRKALDGPATRPKTPLAVENGVGKLAAPARVAPNASPGKREWRTPIPHLSLLDRKVGQGVIVFRNVLVLLLILGIGKVWNQRCHRKSAVNESVVPCPRIRCLGLATNQATSSGCKSLDKVSCPQRS